MAGRHENQAEFIGTIVERIELESLYEIIQREQELLCRIVLHVQRASGKVDRIVVLAEKEELKRYRIGKGLKISVEGEIRTCNRYSSPSGKRHVVTYVRARKIRRVHTSTADKNKVIMNGTLAQIPKYWKSPKGSRKVEFNQCTKDSREASHSFIPCIARDRLADILCELVQWEELSFEGELQSREYIRTLETGEKQHETALEVIVSRLI